MKPEDPKRYDFQGAVSEQGHLYARAIVKQSGKWVKFEDYENLRADLSLALANQYATEKLTYQLETQLDNLRSASIDEHAKEASTRIAILTAQLKGTRRLIQNLQDELRETMAERDKLAGIGIECGCGEADCTADADNLRDALAQIRRLIAAGDGMASSIQFNEEMEKDYSGATLVRQCVKEWNKAKGGNKQ